MFATDGSPGSGFLGLDLPRDNVAQGNHFCPPVTPAEVEVLLGGMEGPFSLASITQRPSA